MITIEISVNNKLYTASNFPLLVGEMADKPIAIAATCIETFIHFKNVRSFAKNNF